MTVLTGYAIALLMALTPWLADELPAITRSAAVRAVGLLAGRTLVLMAVGALVVAMFIYQPSLGLAVKEAVPGR